MTKSSKLFKVDIDCVSDELRKKAKSTTYGILYGKGMKSLSEDIECTVNEADQFITDFKSMYPAIQVYQNHVRTECSKNGYITTIMGRRRYLPQINSTNLFER